MTKQIFSRTFGMIAGATMLVAAVPATAMDSPEEMAKMLDANLDGVITRDEWVSYYSMKAAKDFDKMSKGKAGMKVDEAFQNFRNLTQGIG